jgi:hypothetical protein
MRGQILMTVFAVSGCAATPPSEPPPPEPADNPRPIVVDGNELVTRNKQCLTAELKRIAAETYAGTRDDPPDRSFDEMTDLAIIRCIPDLRTRPSRVQHTARMNIVVMAMHESGAALKNWIDRRRKNFDAKAGDQVKLKEEEPATIAAWRACLTKNAQQLALTSDQPVQSIARDSFAACKAQRDNVIELHKRYGEPGFDAAIMDEVEHGLTNILMLDVMRARAGNTTPERPSPQPAIPSTSARGAAPI